MPADTVLGLVADLMRVSLKVVDGATSLITASHILLCCGAIKHSDAGSTAIIGVNFLHFNKICHSYELNTSGC